MYILFSTSQPWCATTQYVAINDRPQRRSSDRRQVGNTDDCGYYLNNCVLYYTFIFLSHFLHTLCPAVVLPNLATNQPTTIQMEIGVCMVVVVKWAAD